MSGVVSFPRIHQLATEVANQIAAGEVIERPASVVKELLENSIDASATKIQIEIEQAGTNRIRVHDNGQGIHKDDLKLALMPHATSKLTLFSDLSQIASLGFRGEALPSIASVSKLTLTSRLQDSEQAWSIDNKLNLKPAAHGAGTTVDVQDLFHVTPARRKFLKSERTEFLHIQALVKAVALSHCSVGIKLSSDGQVVLNLVPCADNPERRISDICGKSFLRESIMVNFQRDDMHLRGWLGLNDQARSQTDRQYFFVNGRVVQDKHVNHAIRLVYADRIDAGRFASYVLFLQLDPARVDINVHPAKSEVRFAEARNVHDFIYAGLTEAFTLSAQPGFFGDDLQGPVKQKRGRVYEQAAEYRQRHSLQHDFESQPALPNRYLSLLDGRFVVVDREPEPLLIDIEKTNTLLTRHELLHAFRANSVESRQVLVPITCELSTKQLERLPVHTETIKRWGFEIEQVAPTQVAIRATPLLLPYANTVPLVKDFLNHLEPRTQDEAMAATLVAHVNDAGLTVTQESINGLLNRISAYESQQSANGVLPWRRLDITALATILNNPL